MRFFLALIAGANATNLISQFSKMKKSKAGPQGEVYLAGGQVYGPGASNPVANGECQALTTGNPDAPKFKVCGTYAKVKLYLLNNCDGGYKTKDIGACDTSLPPSTCVEVGPGSEDAAVGQTHYQSYEVVPCA